MAASEIMRFLGYPNLIPMTSEDSIQLIEHAKLDLEDLIPITQHLEFSENFEQKNNLKLLEVDSKLLKLLNEGERVTIRGEAEESSVLCTSSETYEIRTAETSNSLVVAPTIFIPNLRDGHIGIQHTVTKSQVSCIHFKYFELKLCQARIGKLYTLLSSRMYSGRHSQDYGYRWEELQNVIQSSDDELVDGLKKLKAYLIKDRWCLLEFDYHFGLLSLFLNYIDSNSISLYAVNKEELLKGVYDDEHRVTVLEQCFEYFFTPLDNDGGKVLYRINEADVSTFCAEVLLKPAGKFNLNEFMNIWQQSVPEGIKTQLSHLEGVALMDESASPPVIWHFPVSALPLDLPRVFAKLFEIRQKWTLEEIKPYLEQFTSPKTNVAALLTKHARAATINGTKYYAARHSS